MSLGDELLPDANLVFDRVGRIRASPEDVWPWLVQLGKGRAGWYLPRRVERALPGRFHASHVIDARFQRLSPGDRVPDYGGREAWLEVAVIDPPATLIYRSERGRSAFTWALVLVPIADSMTEVRLRFRGRIAGGPARRQAIAGVGGLFDWATTELMLRGLRERVEGRAASHKV